jgi:acetylornithine deacetylase/succinyl-diaminopimelate desuccinylase-like protein
METSAADYDKIESFVKTAWSWEEGKKSAVIESLSEYIKIPNDSPSFDPQWAEHGFMDNAVDLLVESIVKLKIQWRERCKADDITIEVFGSREKPEYDDEGKRRTPLIYINIPAFGSGAPDSTVLLYGHLDKQPQTLPWDDGLGPRVPVIKGDRLYGRGAADDGYAIFSAFTAVMALRDQNASHARCVIIVEACEESGSFDLPHYIQELKNRISPVTLIVCLDSGSANYDQLWITNSLRGVITAWLKVSVMKEGVHSGLSSGIVPSAYRIARILLSRLENEATGKIKPSWLKAKIPAAIRAQAKKTAKVLGSKIYSEFPFVNEKARPVTENVTELLLNRTWRPQLAVTGIQGMPVTPQTAGNVMLPFIRLRLSLRLPPPLDAEKAAAAVVKELTISPPYNAVIEVSDVDSGYGWAAPKLAPWLEEANRETSRRFFKSSGGESREAMYMGEGGSIPFMCLLGKIFPQAQFLITGVLGPHSNAHGPNEFLHLPYAQKVTMCVSGVIAAHCDAVRKK